jgi:(p)ppGpp synthase/HD superfamily hydrolase
MLCQDAMKFAIDSHGDQVRKYTQVPYWTHLAEVAGILSILQPLPEFTAAAWLHDVAEDCGVHVEELAVKFNYEVAEYVRQLTDIEEGNRAERQRLKCTRLSLADGGVQTIKYCDIISNAKDIKQFDHKFWPVFKRECSELLFVMEKETHF